MTIISEFVFSQQQEDLVQLGVAIDAVGLQVLRLFQNLPDKQKEELEELMDETLMGIHGTCHCLAKVAYGASNDAEHWTHWAKQEKISIDYRG